MCNSFWMSPNKVMVPPLSRDVKRWGWNGVWSCVRIEITYKNHFSFKHENLKVSNFEPCSGLVNISAIIFSVCKCSNVTCPEVRKLWIQKNLISICLDLSLQDLPVCARHMVDWLSSQIWAGKGGCPWASRKCLNQMICGSASEIPTSSASVELFVTSFCFDGRQYIAPLPKVMYTPVWLLMSELCVANDTSTNAVIFIGPLSSSVEQMRKYWCSYVWTYLYDCYVRRFISVWQRVCRNIGWNLNIDDVH